MSATIIFTDGTMLTAEQNEDCFIMDEQPEFPEDLTFVTIYTDGIRRVLRYAIVQPCASVDGRFWFTLIEENQQARVIRSLQETIEIQAGAIEELAAIIGGME